MVETNQELLTIAVVIVSFVCLCLAMISVQLYRANRNLKSQLAQRVVQSRDDHHQARHDYLTGLLNRRGWDAVLRQAGDDGEWTLVIFDLDQFKRINDQHGHAVGDRVLVEFASRLRQVFEQRAGGRIARLGGEEFGLISKEEPQVVCREVERFLAGLGERPSVFMGIGVTVRCSVGIAGRLEGEGLEGWMHRTDAALYKSKQHGGNRVSIA
jgi:diguanylate cyclase